DVGLVPGAAVNLMLLSLPYEGSKQVASCLLQLRGVMYWDTARLYGELGYGLGYRRRDDYRGTFAAARRGAMSAAVGVEALLGPRIMTGLRVSFDGMPASDRLPAEV